MMISIQILSTSVETKPTSKGSYQQLEVAYKNLTFQGKVESKKLMSFGANADAFKALASAGPTTYWEVEVVKNDKGYNDWVKVTRMETAPSVTIPATKGTATVGTSISTKGNWETPEERAQKQVYIIRQSSLSNAVAMLTPGAKAPVKMEDVLKLAKELEEYVLDKVVSADTVAAQDIESLEEDSLDIPF